MDDLNWLREYVGDEPTSAPKNTNANTSQASTTTKPRSNRGSTKAPRLTRFPALQKVVAVGAQIFDNGPSPGRGKSQHVLKLRVYLDDGQRVDCREPHWWRCASLLDPALVVRWAEGEHAAGRISQKMLTEYQSVADELTTWKTSEAEADWAKMGHIGSPPRAIYFHGQFVAVRATSSGEVAVAVHLHGDGVIEIEDMRPSTRSRSQRAARYYGYHDPQGVISAREDLDGDE